MNPTNIESLAAHCVAKRAIEIAVAGDHSVLFVGPRGAGKDSLVQAHFSLSLQLGECAGWDGPEARAVLQCWCGAEGNPSQACACSPKAKERYARKLRTIAHDYDICIEVCPVPVKEYGTRPGERVTSAQVLARALPVRALQAQRGNIPLGTGTGAYRGCLESLLTQLDDAGRRTFEMAVRRLGLGCGDTDKVLRVARTIADLEGTKGIPARALAEAVQYRALPFMR